MTFQEKPAETVWNRKLSEEGRGLFMIGVGVLTVALIFLSQKIFGGHHGHSLTIFISSRSWVLLAVSPLFFAIGLAYIALGSRASQILGPPKQPTTLGGAMYVLAVAIGCGFAWWVDHHHQILFGR